MRQVTGDQLQHPPVRVMPIAPPDDVAAGAGEPLSYRPPRDDARQRVHLVTAYVLAALQIPVVGWIFFALASELGEWRWLHASERTMGVLAALVGVAGVVAVAGLLFWRRVPWRLTFAGQVILTLAELLLVVALLPWLAGACMVGPLLLALAACAVFAPIYLLQGHVRAAFADEPDPWAWMVPEDEDP
jgi:hypothetical protein